MPLPAGRKPELNPLIVIFVSCAGMHGEANVDWIALWFPCVTGESRNRQHGFEDRQCRDKIVAHGAGLLAGLEFVVRHADDRCRDLGLAV